MILETVVVGALEVNCYILAQGPGHKAVIIDPGDEEHKIKKALARHRLSAGMVINTHGHYDHIGCDDAFGVPVYVHADDAGMLRDARRNYSAAVATPVRVAGSIQKLEDNQVIDFDGIRLEVRHIPGHSPGGIALVLQAPVTGAVFTGDSLFCGNIGRTDLGGDEDALLAAIRGKLLNLEPETVVYPGHGPSSTIADELRRNPFFS
ncbi:MAG: MBL fold metallo-hydrolase [Candidatus Omnitrophica bacterium]|nr:MBL fold metallo-hydrolase [Candidatus Omnitrophota bacterium]